MSELIPNYTDADFLTLKARFKTVLSKMDTFKDYDFEGSNISILMELMAYVGDLNTYFTNRLAQNIHTETANIYECVHSLVRQQGHEPTGYVAAEVELLVVVDRVDINNQITSYFERDYVLTVPKWFSLNTGLKDDSDNDIYYCTTQEYNYTITQADVLNGKAQFTIKMRQGIPLQQPLEYTGNDIVYNQIVLPFSKWDMGNYPYDSDSQTPSIYVEVGDTEELWERIADFYDEVSGTREIDNAYMMLYDKYKRYVLSFSSTRNIPSIDHNINVYLIETLGTDGKIAKGAIRNIADPNNIKPLTGNNPIISTIQGTPGVPFLKSYYGGQEMHVLPAYQYGVTNDDYCGWIGQSSYGSADPQEIEELKDAGKSAAHSQNRNVTKYDYIGNLERRQDILKANAWGEQEQHPQTLITTNYNRAYLSVIPWDWKDLPNRAQDWDVTNNNDIELGLYTVISSTFKGQSQNDQILFPTDDDEQGGYNEDWKDQLLLYLEPKKMLGIWEEFILPELVYFRIDFGLRTKRVYSWNEVRNTVHNKLMYYFNAENREFADTIDFREVVRYILDTGNVSPDDDFALVRGINDLVIRDVMIYRNPLVANLEDTVGSITTQIECESRGWTWALNDPEDTESGYHCVKADTEVSCVQKGGTWDGDTLTCTVPLCTHIYPQNRYGYYPQTINTSYESAGDYKYNILVPVKLGFNQFPRLAAEYCVYVNEG